MEAELDTIWTKALENIQRKVTPLAYNTCFINTAAIAILEGSFIISVPNKFTKEWIEERHIPMIKTALAAAMGKEIGIKIVVRKDEVTGQVVRPAAETSAAGDERGPSEEQVGGSVVGVTPRRAVPSQFNPRYVFENFVVGDGNQFAHAASLAVAERPAKAYNPLFIYGGAGLGKTHLMHAIGTYASTLHPEIKVKYVTTEAFLNEFIAQVRAKGSDRNMIPFQKKYRGVDILLIDDIQFIIDKTSTQEEFFHIFNTLYENQKQLVISSDRPPKEMPTLEDRLRSRFEMGLVVDIQPPKLETRIAILQKKAEASGVDIPGEVLEFIAGRRQLNVRELEGALTRIAAFAELTNSIIDISLAKSVLKEILPETKPKKISSRAIMNETAKYFGVSVAELQGTSRSRHISYPRQIAMYLIRDLTDASLPKIGEGFGGKDHTTIMYGIKKITDEVRKNRETKEQVSELINRIKNKES